MTTVAATGRCRTRRSRSAGATVKAFLEPPRRLSAVTDERPHARRPFPRCAEAAVSPAPPHGTADAVVPSSYPPVRVSSPRPSRVVERAADGVAGRPPPSDATVGRNVCGRNRLPGPSGRGLRPHLLRRRPPFQEHGRRLWQRWRAPPRPREQSSTVCGPRHSAGLAARRALQGLGADAHKPSRVQRAPGAPARPRRRRSHCGRCAAGVRRQQQLPYASVHREPRIAPRCVHLVTCAQIFTGIAGEERGRRANGGIDGRAAHEFAACSHARVDHIAEPLVVGLIAFGRARSRASAASWDWPVFELWRYGDSRPLAGGHEPARSGAQSRRRLVERVALLSTQLHHRPYGVAGAHRHSSERSGHRGRGHHSAPRSRTECTTSGPPFPGPANPPERRAVVGS